MRFRFRAEALQAGEAALATFTLTQIHNASLVVARAVFKDTVDSQDTYLASIATEQRIKKWGDYTDVTIVARPNAIYDDAIVILSSVTADDLANHANTIVAEVVDATMIAQANSVVPGKTRWSNYPAP